MEEKIPSHRKSQKVSIALTSGQAMGNAGAFGCRSGMYPFISQLLERQNKIPKLLKVSTKTKFLAVL